MGDTDTHKQTNRLTVGDFFIESWVREGHKRDYSYRGNHLPELSVKSASIDTLFLPEDECADKGQA